MNKLTFSSCTADESCKSCGFRLWNPLAGNGLLTVGLYDDGRFPGRLLVKLNDHYDHYDEVPVSTLNSFMSGIRDVTKIIKRVLEVERVNFSILGNAESHVHAHLIPRRVTDPLPAKAPWEDPRPRCVLPEETRKQLLIALTDGLVR